MKEKQKVYIATRFENWRAAKELSSRLGALGYRVVCAWWEMAERLEKAPPGNMDRDERAALNRSNALLDVEGVQDCDVLIHIYTPENRGAWGEHVAALALGKRVFFFAGSEEMGGLWNVFTFHPLCQRIAYDTEASIARAFDFLVSRKPYTLDANGF